MNFKNPTARGLLRIGLFFGLTALAAVGLDFAIDAGLRKIPTSVYGATNRAFQGKANADIVISGSSRAVGHFDPRLIENATGLDCFNLGRNGSQTDMQVAVLKTYLRHNRKPRYIIHSLDAFSFVTTKEVYDPAQYFPYLHEPDIYEALLDVDRNSWKLKYLPLYAYAVQDMRLNWIQGARALLGFYPKEDHFSGFNPRFDSWSEEFEEFKFSNPTGVKFEVEPQGIAVLEGLAILCREEHIPLILVYSPEYAGMQTLTRNREEIFQHFRDLSERHQMPFWDYSEWVHGPNRDYFQNSQHLNARGAEAFTTELSGRITALQRSQSGRSDR